MRKLNTDIVREYDIRGIFDKDLFVENAYDIGLSLGLRAKNNNSDIIIKKGYNITVSNF